MVDLANFKESAIHKSFSSNKKRSHQLKSSTKSSDVCQKVKPEAYRLVSQWLTVLSNVRASEMVHGLFDDVVMVQENDGFLTRCLDGKKATDCRLQSVAVGTSARGGLGKLSVRGINKDTKLRFIVIDCGCPSLKVLSCYGITDLGLEAIGNGCGFLKQMLFKKCYFVSDKGLVSFTEFEAAKSLECLQLEECNKISLTRDLGRRLKRGEGGGGGGGDD
ncbi:putative leucine-rich repeat domain superfamily [Helianthus annuus]|nr:putative leucine-rich repeat domain superfamily [Helianthus annuus]